MGAFGDRLRREREMRGITLEEITESTKISRRHLEALEASILTSFPAASSTKDLSALMRVFLASMKTAQWPTTRPPATSSLNRKISFPLRYTKSLIVI